MNRIGLSPWLLALVLGVAGSALAQSSVPQEDAAVGVQMPEKSPGAVLRISMGNRPSTEVITVALSTPPPQLSTTSASSARRRASGNPAGGGHAEGASSPCARSASMRSAVALLLALAGPAGYRRTRTRPLDTVLGRDSITYPAAWPDELRHPAVPQALRRAVLTSLIVVASPGTGAIYTIAAGLSRGTSEAGAVGRPKLGFAHAHQARNIRRLHGAGCDPCRRAFRGAGKERRDPRGRPSEGLPSRPRVRRSSP